MKVNSVSPQEVNKYPNYVFMYFYQLVVAESLRLIFIITDYIVYVELRGKTANFLKDLVSDCVISVKNSYKKDVYSCSS